jgi:type II secretory pathway pseudopilin PulG
MSRWRDQRGFDVALQARKELGFNLVELLISMSMATVLFMAVATMFVRQGSLVQTQNDQAEMNRDARFVLDHLRRDLGSLGSNATPNSAVDPLVCLKPATQLRAIAVTVNGYVQNPAANPNMAPLSVQLFGSLDVKARFRTATIDASTVTLSQDAANPPPTTQDAWDDAFRAGRWLRIAGADGQMMYFTITGSSFGNLTITVSGTIPRVGPGQPCGYAGFGQNYWIDVQNFVRYRVIADPRPAVKLDLNGKPEKGVLVREEMDATSAVIVRQVILAENAVDLGLADVGWDDDFAPDQVKAKMAYMADDVVADKSGNGLLGTGPAARPEALRFLTVKFRLRSEWPVKELVHQPRSYAFAPVDTWLVADDGRGAYPVATIAARVSLPAMTSRNL